MTGLDVAEDNGTIFLVAGTWSTGTLFLGAAAIYMMDVRENEARFTTVRVKNRS